MTATRHPAVRADPAAPCPFCGSGGVALAKLARPRRLPATKRYTPCACAFCEEARRRGYPHSTEQILGTMTYLGGLCAAAQSSEVAYEAPAYRAHLDGGERAVPDVAAGGYRWEKGGNAA